MFHLLSEEDRTGVRSVDRRMTDRAVLIPNRSLVVERRHIRRRLISNAAVTLEAKLTNRASLEHLRVGGAVRGMACGAALNL